MGRVTRGKFHSTRRGKVFSRCAAVRKIIQLFGVVRLGIIITSVVQAHAEKIVLDGAREGQVFEGVGAVSAGGSSRLLIDYPEPQRSEILDFLFKPGFGASFQHLKVEIGGGINSTDGTEPTHMRDGSDLSCSRGYEWWLMEQARKRNPQIVLDCLAWGAPAWIGQGNYYSQDMADYIANFIAGARKEHNLEIQYTGVWNETPYDVEWIKLLRRTLDQRGFAQVKIVAADEMGSWSIGEKIAADPELAAAVNVIGSHYSSTVPAEVRSLGKPIWASESGAQSGEFWAAKQTAALLNRNYIEGAITKTEIWSLVSSCYEVLLLSDSGPMLAREPWSGHYEVLPALWSIAHTTQFAKPGWKYLDGNACGTLPLGGTFVSLKSTNNSDYSIIIETGDASAPQTLMFVLTNGLSTGPVHIWRTSSAGSFQPAGTIFVGGTQFSFEFKRNSIYTLSTTSIEQAVWSPPESKSFPMPYSDDFQQYAAGSSPHLFSDQAGTFEIAETSEARGKCLRQVLSEPGIRWQISEFTPYTILGDTFLQDYEISVEVLLEDEGFASLLGRIESITRVVPAGYCAKLYSDGHWEIWKKSRIVNSGSFDFAAHAWHLASLQFSGTRITLTVDGQVLWRGSDATYVAGLAGIGSGWHHAQFRNFHLSPMHSSANLAREAKITASSLWSDQFGPNMAADGDYASCWSANSALAPQWIEFDLPEPAGVSRLVFWEREPYDQRLKAWRLQAWLENQWMDVGVGIWQQRALAFPRVQSEKFRLMIDQAYSPPLLRELQLLDEAIDTDLTINEWMIPNMSLKTTTDQSSSAWVEIYNSGSSPIDLSGYRLRGQNDFVFPGGTIINAHEHLVVSENQGRGLTIADAAAPALKLSNAQAITLFTNSGEIADHVDLSGAGMPMGSNDDGAHSISLLPQATPGQPNEFISCSISMERGGAPAIHISCKGQPFRKYSLHRKTRLSDDDWALEAEQLAASDGTVDFVATVANTSSIYRISRE